MSDLHHQQEALRERMYDPRARYLHLLERIRWAEKTVRRATPAACIANERRILNGERARDIHRAPPA